MRLLVCGGRNFDDRERLLTAMNSAVRGVSMATVTVIHGGARGADSMAGVIANDVRVPVIVFRADWERDGNSAGPKRNQRMLDEGKPDLVLAMPGGVGTADMVRRARAAGVPVMEG
jgi:predicted Rossmann-fold nucleotide-binding protein